MTTVPVPTVYAVMEDDDNGSWTRGVFATRDLAEQYCVEEQRKAWQHLVDRTNKPIPGTRQWSFSFDGTTGACSSKLISEKYYEHPGMFEWWSQQPANKTELRIEDHDVIVALNPSST